MEQKAENPNEEDIKKREILKICVCESCWRNLGSAKNISPGMQLGWPQHKDAINIGDGQVKF